MLFILASEHNSKSCFMRCQDNLETRMNLSISICRAQPNLVDRGWTSASKSTFHKGGLQTTHGRMSPGSYGMNYSQRRIWHHDDRPPKP